MTYLFSQFLALLKGKKALLKMTSSSYLQVPVSLVVAFVTYRVIDPYFMGIWATIAMFEVYANVMRLGIVNGMNREFPHALGSGNLNLAKKYAQTTLSINIWGIVILWIISPILVSQYELSTDYLICFGVGLIRVSLSQYTTYLSGTFRTSDNFNHLANIQYFNLALNIILIPCIYFYGFYGYLFMQLVLTIANSLLLHRYRPIKVKPKFDKDVFVTLFKTGFPLFLVSYILSFIDTLPRLFILYFGNETLLGLYAPVIMIISTLGILPNSLGTYFYPKLSFEYGKNSDPIQIWQKIKKIYLISLISIIPFVFIGYLLLDYVILFFPKYQQSLPYMKTAIFVGPFVLVKLGNLINIILKKYSFMTTYVLIYGVAQIISLCTLFYIFSDDILMVSTLSAIFVSASMFIVNYYLNRKVAFLSKNGM
ncbi:MAG: hypothetical protein LCH52_11165 [Bacteroidetes bacterium]|nr:hypothetical protein [Bacteroidota bacterium]